MERKSKKKKKNGEHRGGPRDAICFLKMVLREGKHVPGNQSSFLSPFYKGELYGEGSRRGKGGK